MIQIYLFIWGDYHKEVSPSLNQRSNSIGHGMQDLSIPHISSNSLFPRVCVHMATGRTSAYWDGRHSSAALHSALSGIMGESRPEHCGNCTVPSQGGRPHTHSLYRKTGKNHPANMNMFALAPPSMVFLIVTEVQVLCSWTA